ncbi:hypothetical protein D3C76_1244710 [compost metagenome]
MIVHGRPTISAERIAISIRLCISLLLLLTLASLIAGINAVDNDCVKKLGRNNIGRAYPAKSPNCLVAISTPTPNRTRLFVISKGRNA